LRGKGLVPTPDSGNPASWNLQHCELTVFIELGAVDHGSVTQ